jgi:hypothetical protein
MFRKNSSGYSLVFVGHLRNKVVFYKIPKCTFKDAVETYKELEKKKWSFLTFIDGLNYANVPVEFEFFDVVSTSQNVTGMTSQESVDKVICLFCSWT